MSIPNKKYIVLTAPSLPILEDTVNEYIDAGFVPTGGIIVYNTAMRAERYAQAVIRLEREVNKR